MARSTRSWFGAALVTAIAAAAAPAFAAGVAFNKGDVLAAVGTGMVKHFSPTGTLLDTLDTTTGSNETTGMCFDGAGHLFATSFGASKVSKFDTSGNLLVANFGSGYNADTESCVVSSANNVFVGQADGTHNVLKFDSAGNSLATFAPTTDARGTDWIDLAADQCTLFYAGEGALIKRFNVCTNTQLTDFASGLGGPCYALRIRPNGEVMVACSSQVHRLTSGGTIAQSYPAATYTTSNLFALNLDPDGASFWTGSISDGSVVHANITTGAQITKFSSAPFTDLAGLAVVGEITVSQPTPTPTPLVGGATPTPTPLPFTAGVPTLGLRGLTLLALALAAIGVFLARGLSR